ncbi:iron chelate uptake ABC transporter family permease subunit [Serratia nematodiphila]
MGHRRAEPTGLEHGAVYPAAFAGGRCAGGAIAAPADAAGAGRRRGAQPGVGAVDGALLRLGLAIIFSAMLVSAVGVIGFIGLFAPLMAKMLGARRLAHRMMLAPLLGALLLWLTDQVMLGVTQVWREIPTGAATALFGAPLLLWLLPRLRSAATPPPMNLGDKVPAERGNLPGWILLGGLVLLIGLTLALMLGKNATAGTGAWGQNWTPCCRGAGRGCCRRWPRA